MACASSDPNMSGTVIWTDDARADLTADRNRCSTATCKPACLQMKVRRHGTAGCHAWQSEAARRDTVSLDRLGHRRVEHTSSHARRTMWVLPLRAAEYKSVRDGSALRHNAPDRACAPFGPASRIAGNSNHG